MQEKQASIKEIGKIRAKVDERSRLAKAVVYTFNAENKKSDRSARGSR